MSSPGTVSVDAVVGVMARHLSELNARAVVSRAMRSLGAQELTAANYGALLGAMERGVRLFAGPAQVAEIEQALRGLAVPDAPAQGRDLPVREESDVAISRLAARELAQSLGCRPLVVQRIATIVSELSRNIVLYTPGGSIQLEPLGAPPRTIGIVARDEGEGIADVPLVLSGQYKSKTGMGRGLAGVRRLADRFDVETGPNGTTVWVEIRLEGNKA